MTTTIKLYNYKKTVKLVESRFDFGDLYMEFIHGNCNNMKSFAKTAIG